ncbi:MAG: tetratricopeptide repeat protein [Sulfurimonas sp.]|jgi:TolA-binding protein|uniref:tetratricopeptide repeat protein n=1 Tax=Sulfurimonas sp. TaxID=2022749 RepID=UPI002A37CCCD|nr:tetratricopeptide repeat protein [Sulfurimonas sp.]
MSSSKIIAILAVILPHYLIAAEPSAFGAGDLNNPNPYGLTSTEATILETKKNLNKIVVKSNNQANEFDSLRERVDGLQTIIESINTSTHNNKLKIKSLEDENSRKSEYDKRIIESIQVNTKDVEKIHLQIIEISKLLDVINLSYVKKDEFNSLVNDMNKLKSLMLKDSSSKDSTNKSKTIKSKDSELPNADVEKKAKALYDKKSYAESVELYKELAEKNYKPALSNYMIGEIEYYRKNYADAIAYFKKSATLHSKAGYMPVLMLHTAASMEKIGDVKNAKVFYDAIITQYPESEHAKSAKSKLNSIK